MSRRARSKDARNNEDFDLQPSIKETLDELVVLLAARGFGEQGPPRDTAFAQIEQFGHQAGRMVSRAIDEKLAEQHASQFTNRLFATRLACEMFFPARIPLRLDGSSSSTAVLKKEEGAGGGACSVVCDWRIVAARAG